ncbi:MAG: transporter [Phycisphaeraceae bacterium]|nr:transporter [Phycisphaeraceae bacterium]|tara:strand:- start:1305 stop:1748 length:444 start_codon:yes stop_codon:yes gene_type:complete
MLNTKLIHPDILEVLARAGHGSKVLIADGNYPASTTLGMNATLVNLNLAPGMVGCTDILKALVSTIPIEIATVMSYDKAGAHALEADPPIWSEFRQILGHHGGPTEFEFIDRLDFYEVVRGPDICLVIASGDQRIYANLMLTIGVVK